MSNQPLADKSTFAAVALMLAVALAGCVGNAAPDQAGNAEDPGDTGTDTDANVTDDEGNTTGNGTVDIWDPDAQTNPNSTYHVHDYWGDKEEIVIAENVQVPSPTPQDWVVGSAQGLTVDRAGAIEFAIPIDTQADKPRYIYPGTSKIEIDLGWSGGEVTQAANEPRDSPAVLMCLNNYAFDPVDPCIQHYQRPDSFYQGFNASHAFDAPGTWVVEGDDQYGNDLLTPTTWDVPHTMKSQWRFALLAETCGPGIAQTRCVPPFDIESFTVTITIHRGKDIPLDPPHLDYYRDRDKITLLPQSTMDGDDVPVDCTQEQVGSYEMRTFTSWADQEFRDRKTPLCQFGGGLIRNLYLDERADSPVIPPGTDVVRVNLEWEQGSGDVPLHIGYRDAVTNWDAPWQFLLQEDGTCSGTSCTFDIPVNNQEADSLYALQSVWEFGVFVESRGQTSPTMPASSLNVQMSIEAAKSVSALQS